MGKNRIKTHDNICIQLLKYRRLISILNIDILIIILIKRKIIKCIK